MLAEIPEGIMQTLGSAFRSRSNDENNNFLVLRFLAACLVVYGHAFGFAAQCSTCSDVVASWLHYRYSGDLGVHIFFTISGFLVFASFDRSRNLGSFVKARALRILPALVVCILLTVLVLGPIVTVRSTHDYFASAQTFEYFWTNSTLYKATIALPGVFETGVMPNIVNGPIWTLPIEARFYLFVAGLGALGWSLRRASANISIVVLGALALYLPAYLPMAGADPTYHRLGAFFAAGALLYINRDSIPLSTGILGILVLCAVWSYGTPTSDFSSGLVVVYAVFWVAFQRKIPLPKFIQDYSYGIYLYGWPIEQLVARKWPAMQPYKLFTVALALSVIMGALSWFLIEKPFLSLRKRRHQSPQPEPSPTETAFPTG